MKQRVWFLWLIAGIFLPGMAVMASPGDFECRGAIANLGRIQSVIQEKERALQRAKREQRVAESELRVCEPGGIITGDKVLECAAKREKFPTFIKQVTEVETKVGETITQFQEALNTVNRVCQ